MQRSLRAQTVTILPYICIYTNNSKISNRFVNLLHSAVYEHRQASYYTRAVKRNSFLIGCDKKEDLLSRAKIREGRTVTCLSRRVVL